MALLDVGIWTTIGAGVLVLGWDLFRMEGDRRQTIEDQLDDAYRRLRSSILDPIIAQIIDSKKAKLNLNAFMTTPIGMKLFSDYKKALYEFIELDGSRHGICINLTYGSWTAIGTGITMIAVSLSNEFYFNSTIMSTLSVMLVVMTTIFLGAFVINYRKKNSHFQDKLKKMRMTT